MTQTYYRTKGQGPRIVVIGGGTGLSVILRGMKKITDNLTAVVTVSDDGGGSGVLREDLGILPPGDIRSCILAMADEEGPMQDILQYRFSEGMLAGQNFGNLFIAAMTGVCGSFEEAVKKTGTILRIRGSVLPVTGADIRLCAELEDGSIIRGESSIPKAVQTSRKPIKRVYLDPAEPEATEGVIEAICEAEAIVIGPGSLYSSIVPNLLVKGIAEAVASAAGKKILICNVMTQPGETDGYDVVRHALTVNEYLGTNALDYVIANNSSMDPEQLASYAKDGAYPVLPGPEDRQILQDHGITLVSGGFAEFRKGYIRHDADRVASVVGGFACL
ncbi:MAG: YvcK family protein [Clostridiales bacterium]|nr:YvcK family protein [Clostridiales bacterium]